MTTKGSSGWHERLQDTHQPTPEVSRKEWGQGRFSELLPKGDEHKHKSLRQKDGELYSR